MPLCDKLPGVEGKQAFKSVLNRPAQPFGHQRMVAMSAPEGLFDDLIDKLEALEAIGGDSHGFGRI
jgi:hypothetical protein